MSNEIHPFATSSDSSLGTPLSDSDEKSTWVIYGVLVAALTYGYWNMLTYTSSYWDNPLYSHGWIIPLFCGYLFWQRRQKLAQVAANERWIGLAVLVASLCLRLYASYYDMNPLDRVSYIGALLGVTQIVGGTAMLRWAGPPLAFLVFMFPLPSRLETTVLWQLQRVAAISSTWTLQLIGIPALREGSKIAIDQLDLDVADACSGLRMGTIFGAMSVALAMMINRPWWDRLAILLSAIPVALFTNVIRITATALLYLAFPESEAIKHFVHDWAGFAMMPIAMGILWLELQLLQKITVPIDTEDYASFGTATDSPLGGASLGMLALAGRLCPAGWGCWGNAMMKNSNRLNLTDVAEVGSTAEFMGEALFGLQFAQAMIGRWPKQAKHPRSTLMDFRSCQQHC